jgi:hypothetical protein
MISRERTMIDRVQEILQNGDTMGRLIAYGGGSAVAAFSQLESASVADWALWISAVAIMGRLVFDIIKWIVERVK